MDSIRTFARLAVLVLLGAFVSMTVGTLLVADVLFTIPLSFFVRFSTDVRGDALAVLFFGVTLAGAVIIPAAWFRRSR